MLPDSILSIKGGYTLACPFCRDVYRQGTVALLLTLNGQSWWVGQGIDEEYCCIACGKLVRGTIHGSGPICMAVYDSEESALQRSTMLRERLLDGTVLDFIDTIPVSRLESSRIDRQ